MFLFIAGIIIGLFVVAFICEPIGEAGAEKVNTWRKSWEQRELKK